MANEGDFRLDGVWYKAKGLPQKSLANQMASKVGQGTSTYADLTSWSAWIQESWEEGSGNLRPHTGGGMLYGEAESRVPNQLILPGLLRQTDVRAIENTTQDARYMPEDRTGSITVGAFPGDTVRVAVRMNLPFDWASPMHEEFMIWFYIKGTEETRVSVEVVEAINPGPTFGSNIIATGSFDVLAGETGYYWHGCRMAIHAPSNVSAGMKWWVILEASFGLGNPEFEIGTSTTPAFSTPSRIHGIQPNGDWLPWTDVSETAMYTSSVNWLKRGSTTLNGTGFFRMVDDLYCFTANYVYKYQRATDNWTPVGAIPVDHEVTSAAVFGSVVYFGGYQPVADSAMKLVSMSTTGVFTEHEDLQNGIVAQLGGYLFHAIQNQVLYTSSPPLGPWVAYEEMVAGPPGWPIASMAIMNSSVYLATGEGLYVLVAGDIVDPVTPWDAPDQDNGRIMITHANALYVAVNNRVVRITSDHTIQDVWMNMEADLIQGRIGKIWAMASVNHWLVVLVAGDYGLGSKPTIWALQDQSWHHVATLPSAPSEVSSYGYDPNVLVNYSMYHDRETQHLWIMTPQRIPYKLYIPDQALNPYNDADNRYMSSAWSEWDWWEGPISEAIKEIGSIAIMGDNITATTPVTVFWQDDDSTEWEELGTATANFTEMPWTLTAGTRPLTRRFKLGLLMQTHDGSETPRVRAIRLKYYLMIKDWWRWSLIIDVSGRSGNEQALRDGTVHTLTGVELLEHLDTVCTQPQAFVYQDVDGRQYEVKVQDANFAYTKSANLESTQDEWWEGIYRITLEQTGPGEYVA